jgi:sterol desaturase/sphingolipid hydroxylase (fatty acid hydroxylase superfamily)
MIPASVASPLLIAAAAFALIVLERRYPYTSGQALFRKGFANDLLLYTIVQSYALSFVIAWITAGIDAMTGISRFPLFSGLADWQVVLISLISHDFYIYWFHRLQHRSPLLWRIHEAHHSVEDVDWLAGSRSHSLEIIVNQTVEFAPLVLLGASPVAMVAKGTIDAIWGMYIHSNVDIRSGPLRFVLNGPEMHRWHHAREIREGGINFATKFAIWDWVFGTARLPAAKPSGFGIDDPAYPDAYIAQHLYVFRRRRP